MFIPTKNREEILQYLFREGVIVAENKNQKKHAALSVTNLEVIQLMRGFATRKLVKAQYAWRHYYYFLTEEGIAHLREVLHIPADIMPATMKKTASSVAPQEGDRRRTWRDGEEAERPRRAGGFGRGNANACYACGEEGHRARECPKQAGDQVKAATAPAPEATEATAQDEAW